MNDLATVELSEDEARDLTDRIRSTVVELLPLIKEAFDRRADRALGYDSWAAYCDAELRGLRLPVEDRRAAVTELRQEGMSTRAIGAALGASEGTVRNDLRTASTAQDYAVEPTSVTSLDGRQRPATQPEPESSPDFPPPSQALPVEDLLPGPIAEQIDQRIAERTQPAAEAWTAEETALREQLEHGRTVVVTMRGPHDRLITWAEARGLFVRVDRRSQWGNPFELGADGDRSTVIGNYRDHYLPHKPSLLDHVHQLRGKALGCWCAPEPCHGDVIADHAQGGQP